MTSVVIDWAGLRKSDRFRQPRSPPAEIRPTPDAPWAVLRVRSCSAPPEMSDDLGSRTGDTSYGQTPPQKRHCCHLPPATSCQCVILPRLASWLYVMYPLAAYLCQWIPGFSSAGEETDRTPAIYRDCWRRLREQRTTRAAANVETNAVPAERGLGPTV